MDLELDSIGPVAREWIARDLAHSSTSYTRAYPLVVDRALGSELWDVDGKRYVDLMAGIAVHNVGHRHPYVVDKVQQALDSFWHICHSDFFVPQAIELSEKLNEIAPMEESIRTYIGNSGTEAVEAAIKLAMYTSGRREFIGFRGAFHGRTLGSLSFTASKYVQRGRFRKAVSVHHVPYPNCYRPVLAKTGADACLADTTIDYMENVLFETTASPRDIAAILIEPIQGEGGYVVPAFGFFARLRAMCNKYGILLIVDEVQSGAGRTGKMWAIEHENVEPDIVCFAKGIGSGMPIGGIMARESVMNWQPGAHGSTYGGNPVTCAAALATIEVIQQENLLQQAAETGAYMMERLLEMQTRHPSMGEVRGRGMMIGVELVEDRESKVAAPKLRDALATIGFEYGVLLLPCGKSTMRLAPPLNIPRLLLDEGLEKFEAALTEAENRYPYQGDLTQFGGYVQRCSCRNAREAYTVPLDEVAALPAQP